MRSARRDRSICDVLNRARPNCTHTTNYNTKPSTFVVTKGLDPFSRVKQTWDANIAAATKDFSEFDQIKLKELLGPDFEQITSMQHLRLHPVVAGPPVGSTGSQPLRILAPLSLNRQNGYNGVRLPSIGSGRYMGDDVLPPVAGVKRRADGVPMP